MRVRLGVLGLALAAGLGASVAGASVSAGGPSGARLRAFDGCPSFLAYVRKQALPLVGPWGVRGMNLFARAVRGHWPVEIPRPEDSRSENLCAVGRAGYHRRRRPVGVGRVER